ncbi:MAG: hypothetical protein COA85_11975 [Robiginitomaculum sp.]|nr:MAG: hypothetical protein COA85_11975 [Robiginitomaculum sp.]
MGLTNLEAYRKHFAALLGVITVKDRVMGVKGRHCNNCHNVAIETLRGNQRALLKITFNQ